MNAVFKMLVIGWMVAVPVVFADELLPNVLIIFADDLGYGDGICVLNTKFIV